MAPSFVRKSTLIGDANKLQNARKQRGNTTLSRIVAPCRIPPPHKYKYTHTTQASMCPPPCKTQVYYFSIPTGGVGNTTNLLTNKLPWHHATRLTKDALGLFNVFFG